MSNHSIGILNKRAIKKNDMLALIAFTLHNYTTTVLESENTLNDMLDSMASSMIE